MCRCRSPVSVWPGAGIAPDRGKPLACGICHAGVLELDLAPRNRTALYSLLTLAPPATTCAIGRLTFRTKPLRSIDRALPGKPQW